MYMLEDRLKRLCNELQSLIYSDNRDISPLLYKEGNFSGGEKPGLELSDWRLFAAHERWGGRDTHCWFRMEAAIPAELTGKTVILTIKTGREGGWDATNPQFIAYINGRLVQGLDVNHHDILLTEKAVDGEKYLIALHSYAGMQDGLLELRAGLSVMNRDVDTLYYNLHVPLEVATLLPKEEKRRIDIVNLLNDAANLIDLRKPYSNEFHQSVARANEFLDKEFYGAYCGQEDVMAHCIGHTHIDVAWLWTLAQTREKTVRSFSTVLNLMEQYPEYLFMSSQPQLYKFIKEDQPELYARIRERVAEGRWEPEGAMWLEADCNISSGESLVRQVLFGTRFFEQEFGVKNRILWLPDVFGYSAALPQILKKSGIDYFMTTKISWNEYNKIPYDTFMWRGLDGTEILTHFITAKDATDKSESHFTTYNGYLAPNQVLGSWQRYQQKGLNNEVLISFGFGDGGGGPTRDMLENARRLGKGIPGCPKVKMTKSLDFFKRLESKVSGNRKLPRWVGELYLEYHRGTYTSIARNKKFNRKSEYLYQDAEWLSVMNRTVAGQAVYPQTELNKGWEGILLNQFHDILPGSSIKQVYEDSREQYLEIMKNGNTLCMQAIRGITSQINLAEDSIVAFNPLGWIRNDVVEVNLPDVLTQVVIHDMDGKEVASQIIEEIKEGKSARKLLFLAEDVPAKGYKAFRVIRQAAAGPAEAASPAAEAPEASLSAAAVPMQVDASTLSNRFFEIRLDDCARIVSIYDRQSGREVIRPGEKANALLAFEDKPHNHDAWDINIYYQEKTWEVDDVQSIKVMENGPVRACLRVRRKFLDSELIQDLMIYREIPRIDFKTTVDWKEKQVLLKAAFPVDIHAEKATYEIQYGNVERPTHWNTSWDYAKFEVCAHKWADLSEGGYGVSLMNDCKFGHDIKDGTLRLTLLKSATSPNEDADREIHEFTYSLYPHAGDWKEAGTVQAAYQLNCPMYASFEQAHGGALPVELSLVSVAGENIVVEVVKKAEDNDDLIIRMYECQNKRTASSLTFFQPVAAAWECDLMENALHSMHITGNGFQFEIMPYEIKTFKLRLK